MNRAAPVARAVLHFARVINRYDFIDNVIRFADPEQFRMMACTLTRESNIESPDYRTAGIPHWVISGRRRREYPLTILRLAGILRREGVKILHTHHYDEALIGILAARLARVPATVIGRHYHDELYVTVSGAKLRALLALEGFCNGRATRIIVPSEAIRELLVRRQGLPAWKVRVIPYGFDFVAERYRLPSEAETLSMRREMGLEDALIVANFGRHHPLKGQDDLLRAFAGFAGEFPHARLMMVGDGPFRRELETLAATLRISRQVRFTGWRRDAGRLMAMSDVVVHPTLLDSFPQVMIEALVFAKPLIITAAAGPRDQVRHHRTGVIIPMRSAEAIREALRWVVTHPEEAREMGEEGRRYVLRELDIRQVVRRYEAVYAEILSEDASRGAAAPISRREEPRPT